MQKVNLNTFTNSEYQIGANKLKIVLWYLCNLLFFKSGNPFYWLKTCILQCFGAKVGTNVLIKPHVSIKYPWKLIIGDNVWIGEHAWIDNIDMVSIGNNVCISQGALIISGNHDYKKSTFNLITKPIEIHDGAWLGAKSIVCGGSIISENSILTVGCVWCGTTEKNGIYKGNPAVYYKERKIE